MSTDAPKRSFWLHQLAEYLIGAAMVGAGLQSPSSLVPAVLGGVIILDAAIVDAPMGAFRLVGRRTHRILDIVVLAAVVVGALWPGVDTGTRLVVLGLGIVMAFVVAGTNYAPTTAAPLPTGGRSEEIGRTAGRLTARGVQAARRKLG